jgi:DNA helicase-4
MPSFKIAVNCNGMIMNTESVLAELQNCDKELQRQRQLKRRRRVLRLLLVGFFVGKDADKRISELTAKRDSALVCVRARLAEIESTNAQISEIAKSNTLLSEIQQKQWISALQSLEKDFSLFKKSGILDETIPKYGELLSDCFEKMLLQTKELICEEISKIVHGDTYLTYPEKEQVANTFKTCQDYLTYCDNSGLISNTSFCAARRDLELHRKFINDYNAKFVEGRKRDYAYLFTKEELCLDEEQKTAVVTDEKYNLVVAAAGSGKTEVLITRIAYLIERRPDGVKPNRILAIAFQKKAVDEIKNRLFERFHVSDVNVMTFHKLGKDIVGKSRGKPFSRRDIVGENEQPRLIKKIYDQKIKEDQEFYDLFLNYMTYYNAPCDEPNDKQAFLDKKEISNYVSIDNTRVKSRAEKEIMDFFLTHKINGKEIKIEYEPDVAEFKPDFRLTEFDLYIEHWGLTEKGQTPSWFKQPSEEYTAIMKSKKEWFLRNNKLFLETFSYEYNEKERGKFIAILQERVSQKLQEKYDSKFEFTPLTYEEIADVAWTPFKDLTPRNIESFIKNAKIYGLTPERVLEKLRSGIWSAKQTS